MLTSYGNALPGAFNLMSASLGLTTAQLDDMMRKGQIIASDALPRFAAMLNTVTKNINVDSLQMSINELKNTWYELVESSGAENVFKSLVESATKALSWLADNITEVKNGFLSFVAVVAGTKLFQHAMASSDQWTARQLANYDKIMAAQKKLELSFAKMNGAASKAGTATPVSMKPIGQTSYAFGAVANLSKDQAREIWTYNQNLIQTAELKRRISGIRMLSDADIARIKTYNQSLVATFGLAEKKSMGFWNGLRNTGLKALASLKAAFMSIGITALISVVLGLLTNMVSKAKEIREEWKKINNIVEDYHKEVERVDESSLADEKKLRSYLAILQDVNNSERQRIRALKEINKMMGTNFGKEALDATKQAYKDIVKEVERWIEATKLQAKIQVQARKAAEAEALIEEKKIQLRDAQAKLNSFTWWDQQGNQHQGPDPASYSDSADYRRTQREVNMLTTSIANLETVSKEADAALESLGVQLFDIELGGNNNSGGTESDISKIRKNYEKELGQLNNLLKEHAITQEEYNEKLNELYLKFWQQAAATGKLSIDALLEKADKGKTLKAIEQWYVDLANNAQAAAGQMAAKLVQKAIEESVDKAMKEAQEALDNEFDKWLDKVIRAQEAEGELMVGKMPSLGRRDTTFDYNKTPADILSENYDLASDYVESLRAFVAKYKQFVGESETVARAVAAVEAELTRMNGELPDLERAMKIAKVKEDIQEIKDEMNKLAYSSLKDMANSMDRVVKAVENIKKAFEGDDSSPWEQFMAVFNGIVQMVDTIYGMYETLQQFSKMSSTMESAELTLIELENTALQQQIALRERLNEIKQEGIIKTGEQMAADYAEAAAANVKTSADAKGSVAGATKSGAGLPFPYNLLAIAAGVAAVLAALASMDKFAEGGIVGGHSFTGDKQLARVNSGEMILNGRQQKNLLDMANGKGGVGSGKVEFKIRGTDLIGVMNNEMSKRRG